MKKVPTSSTPKKLNRQQILNVIYFIDSNKTHSFKLSIGGVKLIAVGLALVGVWTIVSFVGITYFVSEHRQYENRAKRHLATIFEYQNRYENVFEKAYPDFKKEPEDTVVLAKMEPRVEPIKTTVTTLKETKSQLKVENEKHNSDLTAAEEPASSGDEAEAVEHAPKVASALNAKSLVVTTTDNKQSLAVKDTKYKINRNSLVLSFAIYNDSKTDKAEGYLWGVAKFTKDDGQNLFVGAPASVHVGGDGEVLSPTSAYKYSIKFYKAKTLTFDIPPETKGTFNEIDVVLMNKDNQRSIYKLPVVGTKVQGTIPVPTSENSVSTLPDPKTDAKTLSKNTDLDSDGIETPEAKDSDTSGTEPNAKNIPSGE